MHVRFTKAPPAAPADTLTCVRPDGSSSVGAMTRQGILPHEAFHFVVETALGWHDGFFGRIARGAEIDATTVLFHGTRHPWEKMVQGQQCEALIECLQAEQWGGAADPATFAGSLVTMCRRRGVPPPEDILPEDIDRVRLALREFGAAWRPLLPGTSLERTFGS